MEFLLSWLADAVDSGEATPPNVARLAERLTSAGLAVESIREIGADEGGSDFVLDIEVTSNRPDAMCHFGLARELAVALEKPLRQPEAPRFGALSTDGSAGAVRLEDSDGCPRYVARVVRGVRIAPSPAWLRRRLESIGLRSINNVVDATNYVLWELGQPLHAFDLATIPGGELRVRRARAGERLTTLDGKERALDSEILVIADRARAIALAGVMGGAATEVSARTTDVLLESAHFDRRRVRIGAKRLALHTDASHRFERGTDFALCDAASRRCAALIVELAGGVVDEAAIDAIARRPEPVAWRLDPAALERFAGFPIEVEEVERILTGLGFAPRRAAGASWEGTVPGWREVDFEPRRGRAERIAYPQDLYEEVLRHVGFARVPATLPRLGGIDAGSNPEHARALRLRRFLAGLGFAETIHYAFQDRDWDAAYPALERAGAPLALANPLSERHAVLRRSLVPNLVEAARFNANRGAAGVRLFEVGHLFPGGDRPEIEAIAFVAGGRSGGDWDRHPEVDASSLKGVGEALFVEFDRLAPPVRAASLPGIVAGTGGEWLDEDGAPCGWFGLLEGAGTPFPLLAGEIRVAAIPAGRAPRAVVPPPRLPGIAADLTLTHSLELSWAELERAVSGLAVSHLVGFRLKDRYQGAGVPPGAVATTITFNYHGGERTLTQEEVNAGHAALGAELERRFGVARPDSKEKA
jgi:phenylalanyl-tRNA synthetase beta chain